MADTRERNSSKPKRPARVPMNAGNQLAAKGRPGYQRYWALDKVGQLDRFIAAYWEFVLTEDGKKTTVPGGNGYIHYLMEIEQEYYNEDMISQLDRINDSMEARRRPKMVNGEYVPMGHKSSIEKDII